MLRLLLTLAEEAFKNKMKKSPLLGFCMGGCGLKL